MVNEFNDPYRPIVEEIRAIFHVLLMMFKSIWSGIKALICLAYLFEMC